MQQAVSMTIDVFGIPVNLVGISIVLGLCALLYLFYRIQKTDKLDFADLITKDGRSVSLTKVLQLVGGFTATWIMIKLTLTGGLTDILFGIYLSYVAGVEGYSKFVAAKYGYKESSVKDAKKLDAKKLDAKKLDAAVDDLDDPSFKPPKV